MESVAHTVPVGFFLFFPTLAVSALRFVFTCYSSFLVLVFSAFVGYVFGGTSILMAWSMHTAFSMQASR